MSDYEAEARYEHATTILNWNSASVEPPVLTPPSDDDGWMLFSQTPTRATDLFFAGTRVERFLLVWRRRLARVKPAKPVAAKGKGKRASDPPEDDEASDPGLARFLARAGKGKSNVDPSIFDSIR